MHPGLNAQDGVLSLGEGRGTVSRVKIHAGRRSMRKLPLFMRPSFLPVCGEAGAKVEAG